MIFGFLAVAGVVAFINFVKRPLGGDPEKPPVSEADFEDNKNPYRETP